MLVIFFSTYIAFVPAELEASSTYTKISLENGISLDLPANWMVINQSNKTTLEAAIASKLIIPIGSSLPFAANLYDEQKKTIALTNIRVYPNQTVTQRDISGFSASDLKYYDEALEEQIRSSQSAMGGKITHWLGTEVKAINGRRVFVSSYRRVSLIRENTYFIATLFRVIDGQKSFTLTFSYDERHAFLLKMIQEHVVNSLSF